MPARHWLCTELWGCRQYTIEWLENIWVLYWPDWILAPSDVWWDLVILVNAFLQDSNHVYSTSVAFSFVDFHVLFKPYEDYTYPTFISQMEEDTMRVKLHLGVHKERNSWLDQDANPSSSLYGGLGWRNLPQHWNLCATPIYGTNSIKSTTVSSQNREGSPSEFIKRNTNRQP